MRQQFLSAQPIQYNSEEVGIDEGNRDGLRIEVGRSNSSLRVTRIMSELVEFYGKPQAILHVLRSRANS